MRVHVTVELRSLHGRGRILLVRAAVLDSPIDRLHPQSQSFALVSYANILSDTRPTPLRL
jgi:hypothetical protein